MKMISLFSSIASIFHCNSGKRNSLWMNMMGIMARIVCIGLYPFPVILCNSGK